MARAMVVLLIALTLCLATADVVLISLPRRMDVTESYGLRGMGTILGVVLVIVGSMIAMRQPRNAVGWTFLVSGVFTTLLDICTEYGVYALVERPGALPGGEWALWLAQISLSLGVGPLSTYVLLIFPDGRLPSQRWRPVGWYTVAALALWTTVTALVTTRVTGSAGEPVTPGIVFLDRATRQLVSLSFVAPAVILCGAAFVHRVRSSRGIERQQLKWMAYAVTIMVIASVLVPVAYGRRPLEIAQQLTQVLLPVTAGIAILRYRLYDIDVLIKRTLVYGSLSAALAIVYIAGIVVSRQLLAGLAGGSDIGVAASTLVVVALFHPVRTRVQEFVDRRFYRTRYDATRTIDEFSVRLRSDVDLDSVRSDLIGVIHDTIHPAHASVWLRGGQR